MKGYVAAMRRDMDANPYTADEQRVADFLYNRGAGGGNDPIGFILASYDWLVVERNELLVRLAVGAMK